MVIWIEIGCIAINFIFLTDLVNVVSDIYNINRIYEMINTVDLNIGTFSVVFSFVTELCSALWAGTTRLECEDDIRTSIRRRYVQRKCCIESLTRCDGCLTLSERQGISPIAFIFNDGLGRFLRLHTWV